MIRKIKQADRNKLLNILNNISNFTNNEIDVAMELIDITLSDNDASGYSVFVYEQDKKVLGYYCIGRRPLTDGVYDLYWIVSDPNSKEKGIGSKLLEHAENFVTDKNGRWILAETSSKDNYNKTRNFYLRNNYTIISEINDFYSIGDNLIVFGKYFINKTEG